MVYRINLHERTSIPSLAPADSRGGNNPGNFANDRKKASEAGHKGGQHSSGNFARDPARAAEAGRKGGQHSAGNFAENPQRAAEAGRGAAHHRHPPPPQTPLTVRRNPTGSRLPCPAARAPPGGETIWLPSTPA